MNIYEKPDFYSNKAKEDGYVARSVYKLKEINEKFKLIKKGQKILDLGCAPGSWAQYTSQNVDDKGFVVGIDYKEIKINLQNFFFIKGDFYDEQNQNKIKEYSPFDGVISDMAPDTEGDKLTDCYRSSELVKEALSFANKYLKKGGFFVAKIFQGGDEKEVFDFVKKSFKEAKWFKPEACRKISYEIFIVGINFFNKIDFNNTNNKDLIENDTGLMPW
ncbi:MAG TPA: RlmE family RNA methyltransferase [Spirochaetota bacterium]|nr:RlmE family RNA methyltransferase [Spirochaetota bacterium]